MESADLTDVSILRRVASAKRTLAYGAIAGFIATWSISTAIAASEFELGVPIGTFYAVMGISLGSNDPISAAYLGFGLHLATGTIVGGIIGVLAVVVERFRKSRMANIFDPYRAVVMGIGTGVLVWLVLFLPVTAVFIQPSEARIADIISRGHGSSQPFSDSGFVGQAFSGIALSAIAFHVMWGAIFGFILSSLARIKLSMSLAETSSPALPKYGQLSDRSLKLAFFGLAAGVISSLAISGLILLAEKVIELPVGTFYYVLVAGVTNSYPANFSAAVSMGLVMHLLAGSFMGLLMSLTFMISRVGGTAGKGSAFVTRHSAAYGLAFGFGIWLLVFMPISYLVVLPLLNSFENNDVFLAQRLPTGDASFATFSNLASILDQVVYGAVAFNMFFGLLVGIIIQSFSEKYLVSGKAKKQVQSQSAQDGVSA